MPDQPTDSRYWIRNEFGRVWGPFGLATVGRVDLGSAESRARVQVSTDGREFKPLADFPEVVRAFEVAKANQPVRRKFVEVEPPPPPPPPKPKAAPAPVEVEDPSAVPASGSLEQRGPLDLYSRIAGAQLAGRLTFESAAGQTTLWFRKGAPERVEPPHGAQALAEFLVRKHAAPESEVMSALEVSGGPDGDLVDAIYALGVVPPQDVFRLLGEHLVEQLERALAIASGAFRWEPDVAPPAGSFPLGQRWALAAAFVRKQPPGLVRARLGDRIRRTVYRSSGARARLEELHLTAQELRLAAMLDGTRTPEALSLELPGETEALVRVTWFLGEVGYLSFGLEQTAAGAPGRVDEESHAVVEKRSGVEEKAAGEPADAAVVARVAVKSVAVPAPPAKAPDKPLAPPPPKPRPMPPKAAPKPPAPKGPPPVMGASPVAAPKVETESDLAQLVGKWQEANHFEVLGLTPKASQAEVKAAYFQLAKRHHPDSAASGSAELRQLKADLTARLNEAYAALESDEARAKYADDLRTGGTEQVDVGPILEAEEQFQRATILVKARKYAEAEALLDKAILLNADEGEFHAWRAFAVFVQAKEKRLEFPRAVEACEKALKLSPRCAQAHLFIGQMARIVGEHPKAERAFKAVLELEPDNIEAARELRLLRKG